MSSKSKLLALFVAVIAVAGGGIYYWFEIKSYQDFLAHLDESGVAYERIEEEPAGTFNLVNAKMDIGENDPVAFGNLKFTKGKTGYELALAELATSKSLLQAIARRGVTYERVEKTSSDVFNFVNARLDVGLDEFGKLGNFTAIKAQTGYDLTIDDLEVAFGVADASLTIPRIEIKSLEFADKIDATANNLQTLGFLAPILHDKAASIRLENISASGSFTFMNMTFSASLAIEKEVLEHVERGKISSYSDKNITIGVEIDSPLIELAGMVGKVMRIEIASTITRDFELTRFLEFMFLPQENPDTPFETIYSTQEFENLQISQPLEEAKTTYAKIRSSDLTMRGSKKAPVAFVQDLMGMQDLLTKDAEDLRNDPRVVALIENVVSLMKMVGGQKSVVEGMRQTQNVENIGSLVLKVAQIHSYLKGGKFDFSYQDMTIATDIIEIDIGKIALEDFSYIRMLDGLPELFKTLLAGSEAMSEQELFTSMMGMLPHFGEFSIEDFHLEGVQEFRLMGLIGEWSFKRIALSNKYAFDEALIPTTATLAIEDFSMPAFLLTRIPVSSGTIKTPAACVLDGSNANMSYHIDVAWDPETQNLYSSNQIENNVVGAARITAQLGNIPEQFFSFKPLMKEAEYQEITFKNLEIAYDPQGREAVLFTCLATESLEVSAADWRELLASNVEIAGLYDEMDARVKPMRDALAGFIRQGGKLVFSVKAKDKVGAKFKTLSRLKEINNPFNLFEIDLLPQH